jgi:molybdopterin/thiamine biosynthesis adenylyltransferase
MLLSDFQQQRYARHLTLPEIGAAGQERRLAARVLLVGVGGLGLPAESILRPRASARSA